MLFSLIMLCVVMLLIADRISGFLHGEPEPAAQDDGFLADTGEALASFWNSVTELASSASRLDTNIIGDNEVVITPDTVKQVWVWKEDGAIRSARTEPDRGDARTVLIPENMTAAEFFANPAPALSGPGAANETANAATPDRDTDRAEPIEHNPGADLEQLTPEQRRALLNQGMEVLRRRSTDTEQPRAR